MSTYGGNPAISQSALPTSKNIASTSNTTPIVVTTSAAHGIQTGAYVRVSGATDTSANGDWLAGAVTSTQVTLTVIPGGGNSTPGGGGGAAGTIQDLGFGVQATLPDDATTDMDAGSVNVPFEEVLDRTEYLVYRAGPSGTLESTKVNRSGDTMTGDLHMAQGTAVTSDGTGATIGGTWTVTGPWAFTGGSSALAIFNQFITESGSTAKLWGRKSLIRPRVALTDADHTIDVSQGDRFTLPASLAAPRTITLEDSGTGKVPYDGETMTLIWIPFAPGLGTQVTIKRKDGTTIATYDTAQGTQPSMYAFVAEFEYSGGAWKLGQNSGIFYDDAGPGYAGVTPAVGI